MKIITLNADIKRINRRLAPNEQQLKVTRGVRMRDELGGLPRDQHLLQLHTSKVRRSRRARPTSWRTASVGERALSMNQGQLDVTEWATSSKLD